jgi:hypothetical protein
MRVFLVGLGCTLIAMVVAVLVGGIVFADLYLPPYPVGEWLATDPYTLVRMRPFMWDTAAVFVSLLIALCLVAPLLPPTNTARSPGRVAVFLGIAVVASQLGLFALIAMMDPVVTHLHDWGILSVAAIGPGLLASAVGLAGFWRFALPRKNRSDISGRDSVSI